jgi:hypothetical protein
MKEPVREIEVEVLPPGAIPPPRSAEADPGPRVYTKEDSDRETEKPSQFEDPFIALVARLTDTVFSIPGTNIRFGLDPIIGLVAGYGDAAAALTSVLLLWRSASHGVAKIVLAQMALNIVLNATVGAVPVVGDAFSFWFKSNQRNYDLLRKHAGTAASTRPSWLFVLALLAGVGGVLALTVMAYASILLVLIQWIRGA